MISFGPVPSRRLGSSLGINNIPPKACTYACVYCQIGRTTNMQVVRRPFYDPDEIFRDTNSMVEKARHAGTAIDYIAFVPDGEPTLDEHLGREIDLLKPLEIDIAVISNSSLVWREDVRSDLMRADWVSFKIDSCNEKIWRTINRAHGIITLPAIMDGMMKFAGRYSGVLSTEIMLVGGLNDDPGHIQEIADFLADLKPARVYLSIPTRPPAESWVRIPGSESINRAYHILNKKVSGVEYLIEYEGNTFAHTGRIEEDLLRITSVHPMREEAVIAFLDRAGSGWAVIDAMIAAGQLVEIEYEGRKFYLRKFA